MTAAPRVQRGAGASKRSIDDRPNMHTTKQDKQPEGGLLSQEQLASVLSVHPITVSRWTVAGLIPCHRVGRVVRYDLNAVLASIAKAQNKKEGDK